MKLFIYREIWLEFMINNKNYIINNFLGSQLVESAYLNSSVEL